MKDIMEVILNYIQYIYPGFIVIYIYYFIRGISTRNSELFYLKVICISYIVVTLINSIIGFFISEEELGNENVEYIFYTNLLILVVSILIPVISFKIIKLGYIDKILKKLGTPIITSRNEIELIEQKMPDNKAVYVIIHLRGNIVYTGNLIDAETGESGFICIREWNKYSIGSHGDIVKLNNKRVKERNIIFHLSNIEFYEFQYIGLQQKVKDEII